MCSVIVWRIVPRSAYKTTNRSYMVCGKDDLDYNWVHKSIHEFSIVLFHEEFFMDEWITVQKMGAFVSKPPSSSTFIQASVSRQNRNLLHPH